MRSKGRFTSLPCISRSFLTKFVSCTYIMDHACRDSCMRGSRRCSKARLVSLRFSHANILSTLEHDDLMLMMMRVIMMMKVIITMMMMMMITMMMMIMIMMMTMQC